MYEELIQSLREKAEFLTVSEVQKAPPGLSIKNLFAETMSEAADAIEAICDLVVTYEDRQRWIPVTERLPEDGTYLITWKNHTAQGVCMAYYGYYQDGLHRSSKPDFYRYDNEWGDVTFDDVTHWMPLPEPPKEDGE